MKKRTKALLMFIAFAITVLGVVLYRAGYMPSIVYRIFGRRFDNVQILEIRDWAESIRIEEPDAIPREQWPKQLRELQPMRVVKASDGVLYVYFSGGFIPSGLAIVPKKHTIPSEAVKFKVGDSAFLFGR